MANENTDQTAAPEANEKVTDQHTDTTQEQSTDELPAWAREQITKANAEAAKYRTRAKDYESKAKKYDEVEEANKTEQEKLVERAAQLEAQLAEVTAAKTRSDITVKYGLTAEDDILLGTGDEETLAARAEKIAELRKAAAEAVSKPPSNTPTESLKGGNGDVDEPADDSYPAHW